MIKSGTHDYLIVLGILDFLFFLLPYQNLIAFLDKFIWVNMQILIKVLVTFVFQVELFNNIKPLFANKPLMICVNKIDVLQVDDLPEDKQVRRVS